MHSACESWVILIDFRTGAKERVSKESSSTRDSPQMTSLQIAYLLIADYSDSVSPGSNTGSPANLVYSFSSVIACYARLARGPERSAKSLPDRATCSIFLLCTSTIYSQCVVSSGSDIGAS